MNIKFKVVSFSLTALFSANAKAVDYFCESHKFSQSYLVVSTSYMSKVPPYTIDANVLVIDQEKVEKLTGTFESADSAIFTGGVYTLGNNSGEQLKLSIYEEKEVDCSRTRAGCTPNFPGGSGRGWNPGSKQTDDQLPPKKKPFLGSLSNATTSEVKTYTCHDI